MGQDKVLLQYDGETFIERVFFNALECFQRVIISTDSEEHADMIRSLPLFKDRKPEIVTDRYRAVGPMGGIRSVFESTDVQRFSIISVDVPFADMKTLAAIYDRCTLKAAYFKMGDGRVEPLIAAYDRSGYEDIRKSLNAGLFKMRQVIPREDTVIVTDDEIRRECPELSAVDFEMAFRNFNTPEEFASIMKQG